MRIRMRRHLYHRGRRFDLFKADVRRTGDIENDALCTVDGRFKQGTLDSELRGLLGLVFACRASNAHVGIARVLHNGCHVREIKVDQTRNGDQLTDRLHRLSEHIIGDLKGVGKADLLLADIFQTFIGDNDEGVDLTQKLFNTGIRLRNTHF